VRACCISDPKKGHQIFKIEGLFCYWITYNTTELWSFKISIYLELMLYHSILFLNIPFFNMWVFVNWSIVLYIFGYLQTAYLVIYISLHGVSCIKNWMKSRYPMVLFTIHNLEGGGITPLFCWSAMEFKY
jgi:hypothetical protein